MKNYLDKKSLFYLLFLLVTVFVCTLLVQSFDTFIYRVVTIFIGLIVSANCIAGLYLRMVLGKRD